MSRPASLRCVLMLILALATGLAACGRKNPPVPPEGEESRYTYPGFYPSRSSGIPIFGTDREAPDEPAALPADGTDQPAAEQESLGTFGEGPAITPVDRDYTETGPYGTSSQ